jgi:tRNA (guanine37-N1)-methyltransferase
MSWTAQILTLYPEMFPGPLGASLSGKALNDGIWSIETLDIRSFARDKHRSVDDTPAGGGPGMVLRADIVGDAIDAARERAEPDWPLVYPSPRGRPFDQALARHWAGKGGVTFVCGRFEGLDQRVIDARAVEEVSLGDYILSGGEPAALAMMDAVIRLCPA